MNIDYLFKRANQSDAEQEFTASLKEVALQASSECAESFVEELVDEVVEAIKNVVEYGTLEESSTEGGTILDLKKALEDIYSGGQVISRTEVSEMFAEKIAEFIENLLSDRILLKGKLCSEIDFNERVGQAIEKCKNELIFEKVCKNNEQLIRNLLNSIVNFVNDVDQD